MKWNKLEVTLNPSAGSLACLSETILGNTSDSILMKLRGIMLLSTYAF